MKISWMTLAVLAASTVFHTPARAASIIYTTFGPGSSYDNTLTYGVDGNGQFHAFLFHPTASGNLESITVALARDNELTTQTQFNLYSGSATTIGSLIESFLVPNLAPEPGVLVTMNSTSHPTLIAGGNYWLSFTEPGTANGADSLWMFNSQGIHTTRITDQPVFPDGFAPAFQVTATTAPEPATELPVGIGLIASAIGMRRKLRA